jgi:hypothetical protein
VATAIERDTQPAAIRACTLTTRPVKLPGGKTEPPCWGGR